MVSVAKQAVLSLPWLKTLKTGAWFYLYETTNNNCFLAVMIYYCIHLLSFHLVHLVLAFLEALVDPVIKII